MRRIAIIVVATAILGAAVLSIANAESIFQQMYDAIKGKSASQSQNK